MTSAATPGRQESVRQAAEWLTARVPGLAPGRARELVTQAAPNKPGILLGYLRRHPSALTAPVPLPSAPAVRLAHALRREGHAWIALPQCARCGRTPAKLYPRAEGGICGYCERKENAAECARCGRKRPVHERSADGPLCGTCYKRPAKLCELCGETRPLVRRSGPAGPAVCEPCDRKTRILTCSACGRQRPALPRRADGKAYCRACYPRTPKECARCGRLRPVNAEWPIGPVCGTCYAHVRRHPARCAGCGQVAALVGASGTSQICGPCAGWDGPAMSCRECGAPDMLEYGRCFRCVLGSTLADLLAGAAPGNGGQLRQLAAALQAAPNHRSTLRWLRDSGGGRIISGLAASGDRITHELLDQMPISASLNFLRDRLVVTGVIPERTEYIERIPVWTAQLVRDTSEPNARIIRAYAQWDAVHRARRRARRRPYQGHHQAQAVRTKIRIALAFLDWLSGNGTDLAAARQADIDRWLVGHPPHAGSLRPFLSWATARGLCGQLAVPPRPGAEPLPGLSGDKRWHHLRACLDGDSALPLNARAAAAIALLYGAPLTRVLSLRATDIVTVNGRPHMQLGRHPVLLPPAIAALVSQQAAQASPQPDGSAAKNWLFPGRAGIRPLTAPALNERINQQGIRIRDGRTAALVELAGQLPPAVLADLLGLHPSTATAWARRIASDWGAYIDARNRSKGDS